MMQPHIWWIVKPVIITDTGNVFCFVFVSFLDFFLFFNFFTICDSTRSASLQVFVAPPISAPIGLFVCQATEVTKVLLIRRWQVWCRQQGDSGDRQRPIVQFVPFVVFSVKSDERLLSFKDSGAVYRTGQDWSQWM